eukprot:gene10385-19083_t
MNVNCNDFDEKLFNKASYIENIKVCAGSILGLAIPTTLLNLALIIAILSSNECKEPRQMLVLNLAFTDFAAGLYCMPALSVKYFFIATLKNSCSVVNLYRYRLVSIPALIDTGLDRYRSGSIPTWIDTGLDRYRPGSIPAWIDTGLDRYRPGSIPAWIDTGLDRYRPGSIPAWIDTGLDRYRPGSIPAWMSPL